MTNKELLLGGLLAAVVASVVPLIWQSINHIEAEPNTVSITTELRSNNIDIFISNNSDETIDFLKVLLFIEKQYTEDGIYVGRSKVYSVDNDEIEVTLETVSTIQLRVLTHQTIKASYRDRFIIALPKSIAINIDSIRVELIDSSGKSYKAESL